MPAPELLTAAEAAGVARCDRKTIYRALWAGNLRGFQRKAPQGPWLIATPDLLAWVKGEPAPQ
ncbi:helix-turn-helix domain-containing protein [Nocardiaceae bacterium NPDC056970]